MITERYRSFLATISQLAYCNPFLPERVTLERVALGSEFVEGEPVWSLPVDEPERPRANVWRIVERLERSGKRLVIHTIVAGGSEFEQTVRGFNSIASQFPAGAPLVL